MNKGIYFIEGCDFSGKSTFIENKKNELEGLGFSVLILKQPGGTNLSSYLREFYLNNDTSYFVSRYLLGLSHIDVIEEIKKNYKKFDYIFIDRCFLVTDLIYSKIQSDNVNYEKETNKLYENVAQITKLQSEDFDINLMIIDVSYDDLISRFNSRAIVDKFDKKGFIFAEKVWKEYRALSFEKLSKIAIFKKILLKMSRN